MLGGKGSGSLGSKSVKRGGECELSILAEIDGKWGKGGGWGRVNLLIELERCNARVNTLDNLLRNHDGVNMLQRENRREIV